MAIRKDGGFVTMQQHVISSQAEHIKASGEFSWLLSAITLSTKIISSYVRRAGLIDIIGEAHSADGHNQTNVQGEIVQKLDLIANDTLKRTLGYRGNVGIVASEEDNDPKVIQELGKGGKYIVMFDPLDGSSNIDTNVSVGTIFTILERIPGEKSVTQGVLQPGYKQLAAGYVVYGSSTVMVYTVGHGVHMFTLDPQFGAYLLVKENVKMPEYANQYSCNEAYLHTFPEGYGKYLGWAKDHKGGQCSMRYIGSLVADFHRILLKGGVFLYPPTKKNPEGKLRLMYEANPLAFIAEQAGGAATDGRGRVLDIQPTSLHQRTPLIIGGKKNVDEVMKFVR
ncbi:MAG: class 1 fructose-bisphosphatase [Planctomycetes bacterium]|nr:class 1 fructose-bisphosphatase [Planctomycetota bacterium]